MKQTLKFPKGFYWGTATSAYQVEGGIKNDWTQAGGKFDAGKACDHYNRYEEDFDLAKQMNNNAHRFSISWPRIEPRKGKFDQEEIEHYRKVLLALRQRNLEPFVTLYHWPVPVWFVERGHWLGEHSIEYFLQYVEKIVSEFKDLVKFWIPINEPNVYASHSFLIGDWPPRERSFFKVQQVLRILAESHKRSYQIIHKISPNSKVGIAKQNSHYKGLLKFFSDYYWNHQFLQAIKDHQDFIGLNYYQSHSLASLSSLALGLRKKEVSDLGWRIRPKGIYYVLKDLTKYDKPVYITENGLADARDRKRASFIINHLRWVHKAIEDGVDVQGYFYWSLIDNYEWAKMGGFGPRFGLVEIDYDNNFKRIPRPSSKVYSEICKDNALEL